MSHSKGETILEKYKVEVRQVPTMVGFEHTFPCPVCRRRLAIHNLENGVFEPCYECQGKGWLQQNYAGKRMWNLLHMWSEIKGKMREAAICAFQFYKD